MIKIIVLVSWFLFLYLMAFFSARDYYKQSPHFLWLKTHNGLQLWPYGFPYLLLRFVSEKGKRMRLIDADELYSLVKVGEMNEYTEFGEGYNGGIAFALKRIETAPTIDAVPVVRCINCTHYEPKHKYCDMTDWRCFPPDGYCSYGKRRPE